MHRNRSRSLRYIHNNEIDNDLTLPELVKIAISHAEAGSDYVSASDMMDGRVKAIRKALESEGFTDTGIMSYSVKYAVAFTDLSEMLRHHHLSMVTGRVIRWTLDWLQRSNSRSKE